MKVLCIDDDQSVAELVAEIVNYCGHTPLVLTDSMAVVPHLRDPDLGAVLTDYLMPRLDGIEVLTVVQETNARVRRVLITAAPQEAPVKVASASGVVQLVIAKPPRIIDVKLALAWL
jgi:CheY-like chemotaxis protein